MSFDPGFCHCGDEATHYIGNGESVCDHPTCIAYSYMASGMGPRPLPPSGGPGLEAKAPTKHDAARRVERNRDTDA